MAGFVPASLHPPATTRDVDSYVDLTSRTLRAAGAKALVTSPALTERFERVRAACPELRVVLPFEGLTGREGREGRAGQDGRDGREGWDEPSLDDLAFVQFTSGATSDPKGVALTHRNLCANVNAINGPRGLATTGADSAVSWLPLHHDMGLVGMALCPLYASRPAVFLPSQAFVKRPAEWLRAISRHRATVSFAPNFAYDLCVRRVKDADLAGVDLSCWRVAGCGAEPIHAPTLAAFADRFSAVGFRETSFLTGYGLAEHVVAATFAPLGRPLRTDGELVSCGRVLPDHRIKIVDEGFREVPERGVGEIALAGPSVMQGYYEDRALTRETMCDGWLRTGDLGYLSDGELYVCGRAKDLIIANGRKYYPQDLEWGVDDLAGVRRGRSVAFGTSRAHDPDRVVIVVEANGTVSGEQLVRDVRRRMADLHGLYVHDVVDCGERRRGANDERQGPASRDEGAIRAGRARSAVDGMSRLRVVTSTSAVARIGAARQFLERLSSSTECVVVGATRGAADDFVRAIATRSGATFGLSRFGLTELAARSASVRLAGARRAPATQAGGEAVAARAVFEAVAAGELEYFTPVASMPGFPRALSRTIHELRLAGVGPDRLDRSDTATRDVGRLLARVEAELERVGVDDRAALFRLGAEAVRSDQVRWADLPVIFLDVPLDSHADRDFVTAIAGRSPQVLATVPDGDAATTQALVALGGVLDELPDAASESSDLAHLRRHIFFFSKDRPPVRERSGDVRLFSAPGEGREAVEIARRVLDEAERGVPFDEMAVFLRTPQHYLGLLEHACARAGVPAYFDRGIRRPDPAGRAFVALLSCAVEGLSAKRFDEYLSLGQVPQVRRAAKQQPPATSHATRVPSPEPPAPSRGPIIPRDELFGGRAPGIDVADAADATDAGRDPRGHRRPWTSDRLDARFRRRRGCCRHASISLEMGRAHRGVGRRGRADAPRRQCAVAPQARRSGGGLSDADRRAAARGARIGPRGGVRTRSQESSTPARLRAADCGRAGGVAGPDDLG